MKIELKTARKAYPENGIAKGDAYYSWTPYRQPTRRSKTYPRPSQTCSNHWSGVYAAQEALQDSLEGPTTGVLDAPDVLSAVEDAIEALNEPMEAYEAAAEAMGGMGGPSEERCSAIQELQASLEDIQSNLQDLIDGDEDADAGSPDDDDSVTVKLDEILDDLRGLDWDPPN